MRFFSRAERVQPAIEGETLEAAFDRCTKGSLRLGDFIRDPHRPCACGRIVGEVLRFRTHARGGRAADFWIIRLSSGESAMVLKDDAVSVGVML